MKTSLVAQLIESLSAMWETWVRSLGWEDPLEKEMAAHSSTPAWRIPWTKEPGSLQSMGSQRIWHDWEASLHFTSFHFTSSLSQTKVKATHWYSCLENPHEGLHGVIWGYMGSQRVRHDWAGSVAVRTPGLFYSIIWPVPMPCGTRLL